MEPIRKFGCYYARFKWAAREYIVDQCNARGWPMHMKSAVQQRAFENMEARNGRIMTVDDARKAMESMDREAREG